MDPNEVINLINTFEEEPSAKVFKNLMDVFYDNIEVLPIKIRIKLMHTIYKAYDDASIRWLDDPIGVFDDYDLVSDVLPDILAQCVKIAEAHNYANDKDVWINDFYILIKEIVEDDNDYSDDNHKELLKFCALNKNIELCESYALYFPIDDPDLETLAYIHPFWEECPEAPLEVIAKAYSIYAGTNIIERLNERLDLDPLEDPDLFIGEDELLLVLEEMERTQNDEAIYKFCQYMVCNTNLTECDDRLAEKLLKYYLSLDTPLDIHDFHRIYQPPFITERPLKYLKEELDAHNPKAEELADILLTKKSKKQLIENKTKAKAKKQNPSSSDKSVRKSPKRRKRKKKSPLQFIRSLLKPKKRSNRFRPKARCTKYLKKR